MAIELVSKAHGLNLPTLPKFILAILGDHTNAHGEAWPSKNTIASIAGVDPRTVQIWLTRFKKDGVLFCINNELGGRGRTPHYGFNMNLAEEIYGLCQAEKTKRSRAADKKRSSQEKGVKSVSLEKGAPGTPFIKAEEQPKIHSIDVKGVPGAPFIDVKGVLTTPFSEEKRESETLKGESECTKGRTGILPNLQEPSHNLKPLYPLSGENERIFQKLIRLHPGGALGNATKARDAFAALISSNVSGEVLVKAADRYDDQVKEQGIKTCSLTRWLSEGRYLAHMPAGYGPSIERSPASDSNQDRRREITAIMQRYFDTSGLDMAVVGSVRFNYVECRGGFISVSSQMDCDRVISIDGVNEVMLAALSEAGIDVDDIILNIR